MYHLSLLRPFPLLTSISLLSVCGLLVTADSAPTIFPHKDDDSTINIWHFDEGKGTELSDAHSKVAAQISGGVSWGKGISGTALNLNGIDSKIALQGQGYQTFAPDESYTVETWVKVYKPGVTQQIISSGPVYELEVRPEGFVSYHIKSLDGSADLRCSGKTDIVDGKWHQIATVRDVKQGKLLLYVDGHLDGEIVDTTANQKAVAIALNATLGAAPNGREALEGAIDEVRISKTARTYSPLDLTEDVSAQKKYLLENKQVRLVFVVSGNKLFLQELIDKKTGINLIESSLTTSQVSNLWKISMRSGAGTTRSTGTLLDDTEKAPTVSRKKSEKGEELYFTWKGLSVENEPKAVDIVAKVYLPKDSAFSQWRIRMDNGSDRYGAWIVKFPTISNIKKLSPDGQQEYVAIPGGGNSAGAGEGQLLRDPFKNLTKSVRTYPCYQQSMQFNAYYGPKSGLYMATYDGAMHTKGFALFPTSRAKPALNYEVENYPANSGVAGTGFSAEYPSIIGPFQGNWYDAARIYRKWALTQKWAQRGPLYKRTDLAPAIKKGSFWMLGTFEWEPTTQPMMRKLARTLPIEEVQKRARRIDVERSLALVKEAHDYFGYPIVLWTNEWFDGGGDYSPPRYVPMNNLDKYLSELHKRYPEITMDAHFAPKRYSTQLLEYNDSVKKNFEKKPDGQYHLEDPDPRESMDVHAYPCWTTPFWKQTWADLMYKRTKLGLDGVHVDELGSATSFDHQCFNPDHGHPIGGGTLYADTRRAMLKVIRDNGRRANPNFAVHHEVLCEIYIDIDDLSEVCTSPANNGIPLYEAVYHDYNFTMGRRIIKYTDRRTYPKMTDPGTNGIREPGDQGMEEFVASFAETFIWGNQPAWMRADISSYAPKVAAVTKKFMDARYRSMKFLNFGDMARPLTVTKPLPQIKTIWRMNDTPEHIQPAILNSVWKAHDGTIGIVLANISQQTQTINYQFDLAEAGLKGSKYILKRIDGKTPQSLGTTNKSMLERADTVEPWSVKIIEVVPVKS